MTRPLRADARRNRDAMLAAVRHLLATHGPDLSMDAIAESAGVAVGTLYRHFPTKTDLLRAALSQLVEAMVCDVEAVADRGDGGAPARSELLALVDRTLDAAGAERATKAAGGALGTS